MTKFDYSNGSTPVLVCQPRSLPGEKWSQAAQTAVEINPANYPRLEALSLVAPGFSATKERIAAVVTKFWHTNGVHLTVSFLDNPASDLRSRILANMNAWSKTANVRFVETATGGQVRIARTSGDGYWSYVGTDILSIDPEQPTMNLDSFTMSTPEQEFHRVVRHETGHTLGCPHEHMRKELVERIDPEKAIEYFFRTQHWDEQMVRQQVLTPLEESSLIGTIHPDERSIMCYQLPGEITKDGKPIIGGLDIDNSDYSFMGKLYPRVLKSTPALHASTDNLPGGAVEPGRHRHLL
jgi:Astacin (Peptidase family M12A)